ncbi:SurA N-terminal domain-containing protein [Clostridium sp. 'deep sea']|uniref:SurA N-terminal domain-containing protein n=1 Tax=Clostridium sp. 'deep sea' TaxID=2779445 RepID=UPI0018965E63|nr:SurA N-terminal domain-containing protein [Clostridium sp. 'deep sea']QOR34719.1 SurA N-terminal domain-containing protein [Clostridium sp. 'deep sea']
MRKKFMLIILAVSLVFTMAACKKEVAPDPNKVLVVVNDENIIQSEFDIEYTKNIEYLQTNGTTLTKEQDTQLKNNILDSMIREMLIEQYAAKDEYEPTQEDIDKAYQAIIDNYESVEKFNEALKEAKTTEEEQKEILKKKLNTDKYLNDYVKENNLYSQVVVTDKEVEDEFLRIVMQSGNKELKLEDVKDYISSQIKNAKMSKLITTITTTLMTESKIENKVIFE